MIDLRKRKIKDMQFKGMSERTIDSYSRAVPLFAKHCDKSPQIITEEELRHSYATHLLKAGGPPSCSTIPRTG